MSNKDLLKQAIAEAKTIREAAIANAKEALEESLTPHLKDMLAAKLQEMEDADDMDEIVNEEEVMNNPEGETAHGNVAEAEEEEEESEEEAGEEEGEEAEEEAGEEEDLEIEDMSVEDLKDLIRGIVNQEMGNEEEMPGEESAEELGAEDMTGMDTEEEEIDINELLAELEESEEEGMEEGIKDFAKKAGDAAGKAIDYVGDKLHGGKGLGLTKGETVNEVEIEEGLADEMKALAAKYGDAFEKWIDSVGDKLHGGKGLGLNKPGGPGPNEAMEDDLAEALATVETLRGQLQEVNLLNAKLLYVNKVFKSNNLSENQKVNVIAAFDKAETVKEVKLVFETVSKNVVAKPAAIKEHKSFASKATGTTARPANPEIISEVSETVKRMQKLAGII
jgi:hypothetical protein